MRHTCTSLTTSCGHDARALRIACLRAAAVDRKYAFVVRASAGGDMVVPLASQVLML